MTGIQQSGDVTPGHLAVWVTNSVVKDGGSPVIGQRILGSKLGADFFDTNDQAIILPERMTAFWLTGIVVTNASTSLTTAIGGFYPEASKAGSPIVAAGQVYSALTTSSKLMNPTLTAFAQTSRFSRSNLPDWVVYLSLTTPQSIPATADVYLIGIDLSQ